MYFVVVAVVVVVVVAVLFILSFCRARIPGSWDLTESIEMFPDALWFQTSDRSVVCQHVFPESSTPGVLFYFKKTHIDGFRFADGSLCLQLYYDECDFCRVRVRVSSW